MGIAVEISLLSCIQAIYAIRPNYVLPVMAAMFDFRQIHTSDIIISLFVLPDPENMGIAVGISLLSCIEASDQ